MEHLNECRRCYAEHHLPLPLIKPDNNNSSSDDDGDDPFNLNHPDVEAHSDDETIVDFGYSTKEYIDSDSKYNDPNMNPSHKSINK